MQNDCLQTAKDTSNQLTAVPVVHPFCFLPNWDKKKIFNDVQNSEPVNLLVQKNFKVLGLLHEKVEFEVETEDGLAIEIKDKLTILSDVGTFHSYSESVAKAIKRVYMVYGKEWAENTYLLTQKTKTINGATRLVYVLTIV